MKVTIANIIRLWFSADTPIRRYQIKMNPLLWAACERVSANFNPPSGASESAQYRKSDKVAFAKTVLAELQKRRPLIEEVC